MELTHLKRRFKTASRGHKLLKDKQAELVKKFIMLIQKNKRLREEVEAGIEAALKQFVLAKASISESMLEEAIMIPSQTVNLQVAYENIMSVMTPIYKIEKSSESDTFSYSFVSTSSDLDFALIMIQQLFEKMIELAQVEKSCQLLASEIEKTRRRVNALEYIMIPDLGETIKYIKMKLDENERGNRVRLMKVKEIVEKNKA